MKKLFFALVALITALAIPAHAQPGGMNNAKMNRFLKKLFGDNQSFTADAEYKVTSPSENPMTMPGKIAFDSGKVRFEMNLSEISGGRMSPAMAQRMKAMGMDQSVVISRPADKVSYSIFPGLSAYVETPLEDPDASKPDSDVKLESTEIGKETVDGHPCVKNKDVVTEDQGQKHEFTVWNATDLKKFPVKIESDENGRTTTILFKNVKPAKPDAALFNPPSDYKKYANQTELMQQEVMKRMQGMQPQPQPQPRPNHP